MSKSFKTNPAEMFMSIPEDKPQTTEERMKALGIEKLPIGSEYGVIPEKKSERMQLLVRPSVKEAIKKLAQEKDLSMNDLINQIFIEYIERQA